MRSIKNLTLKEINQKYNDLIKPTNFIHVFDTEDEFKEWARMGSVEDLEWAIKEFEKDELYKYCEILKQIKNEKK